MVVPPLPYRRNSISKLPPPSCNYKSALVALISHVINALWSVLGVRRPSASFALTTTKAPVQKSDSALAASL